MIFAIVAGALVAGVNAVSNKPPVGAAATVVSTLPAMDAVVESGPITLSVTFDRAMQRQSYSFVQKSADTYPQCGKNRAEQSADGRTFTLRCEVRPGQRYEVWFNSPPYMNFVGKDGKPAVPYGLRFRTR